MKFDFILANCADPDEMSHHVAFHLGLHCLAVFTKIAILPLKRQEKNASENVVC